MIRRVTNVHRMIFGALFIIIAGLASAGGYFLLRKANIIDDDTQEKVLGKTISWTTTETGKPNQTHFNTVLSPLGGTTVTQSTPIPPTPVVDRFDVALVSGPTDGVVRSNLSFTWQISGPARTIHTTTVYWGSVSTPGTFSLSTEPGATKYTETVKDFMNGNFAVPLRYIGNSIAQAPGTYFYRAYALIDGKHYWSQEKVFFVKPEPRHEIKMVDRPSKIAPGENAAFTWDVFGPAGTASFTIIAGGKESKQGALDETIDLPHTPYAVMVSEFTNGPYNIPLRFIGNAKMTDAGTYYYRALAFINDKYIWSDEYSFTVE